MTPMRDSDIIGSMGCAWKLDLDALAAKVKLDRKDDATVAVWIVEAPYAHPVWHSYFMALIHLRPMPDKRKTIIYLEGATHEIWLYAMDPIVDRELYLRGEKQPDGRGILLTPKNFAAQFIADSDEAAEDRAKAALYGILAGTLNPDTDNFQAWRDTFGDNMVKPEYR